MQRSWINGIKKIIFFAILLVCVVFLILLDQSTKTYIKGLDENTDWVSTTVIDGFFYFCPRYNSGAAWSFLADKSWGQTVFKIITPFALVIFAFILVWSFVKKYKFLSFSMVLIISGTIGNYIDRLRYGFVVDFISWVFGSYNFPVFNLADSYMTVGIIMLIIHFLFLDKNAVFKKNGKEESNG